MTDSVYVRDTSSRRVHKRFREEGQKTLASYEGCNSDSSGAFSVLTVAELEATEADDLCGRCFLLNTAEAVTARLEGK